MKTFILLAFIAGALANSKYPDTCGYENKPETTERVIGGHVAGPNQFPWIVAVTGGGYCTGSILSDTWIITAAHCLPKDNAWIRAGINHRFDTSEPYIQERFSNKTYKSPNGDFALIELDEPLVLSDYVRPICLPTLAEIEEGFSYPLKTTVAGWGVTSWPNTEAHRRLHFADNVEVKPCPDSIDTICADTSNGIATCFGDGGGPLNYEFEEGRYKQIGVVQFASDINCINGINGYARLRIHYEFIQKITGIMFV